MTMKRMKRMMMMRRRMACLECHIDSEKESRFHQDRYREGKRRLASTCVHPPCQLDQDVLWIHRFVQTRMRQERSAIAIGSSGSSGSSLHCLSGSRKNRLQ